MGALPKNPPTSAALGYSLMQRQAVLAGAFSVLRTRACVSTRQCEGEPCQARLLTGIRGSCLLGESRYMRRASR